MSGLDLVPQSQKNVGGYDRIARVLVGVALLALGALVYTGGQTMLAALSVVAAVGLFFNAATQFCGINALLGVNTCDADEC
jgi:type IV secretory pathway VirB2 component (pilin)